MNRSKRIGIQKNLDKIISGTFDKEHVLHLFTELRPFANGDRTFLEFADFVAHPVRNTGLFVEALEFQEYRSQFFKDYFFTDNRLDLSGSFKFYILDMMKYMVKTTEPHHFKKIKLDKKSILKFINEGFEVSNDMANLRSDFRMSYNSGVGLVGVLEFLEYIVQLISVKPVFSQKMLLSSLSRLLHQNGIVFKSDSLKKQYNKIMVYILVHLHRSEYKLPNKSKVYCKIAGLEYRRENQEGRVVTISKLLSLSASFDSKVFMKDLGQEFPIRQRSQLLDTTLLALEWCDNSIFMDVETIFPDFKQMWASYDDHDFEVINFKICSTMPYEGNGEVTVTKKEEEGFFEFTLNSKKLVEQSILHSL